MKLFIRIKKVDCPFVIIFKAFKSKLLFFKFIEHKIDDNFTFRKNLLN